MPCPRTQQASFPAFSPHYRFFVLSAKQGSDEFSNSAYCLDKFKYRIRSFNSDWLCRETRSTFNASYGISQIDVEITKVNSSSSVFGSLMKMGTSILSLWATGGLQMVCWGIASVVCFSYYIPSRLKSRSSSPLQSFSVLSKPLAHQI